MKERREKERKEGRSKGGRERGTGIQVQERNFPNMWSLLGFSILSHLQGKGPLFILGLSGGDKVPTMILLM